jgi:hypothetical protein
MPECWNCHIKTGTLYKCSTNIQCGIVEPVYVCYDCLLENPEYFCKEAGYHVSVITRGVLGEISKIREELEELTDAASQNCVIMELVELSDLIGAVDAYLLKHHPSICLDDLIIMSKITKRAFQSGERTNKL